MQTNDLIHTDGLVKTYSTPHVARCASVYNERRWLAWELLCGKVDKEHALWAVQLTTFSSDLLFDGRRRHPYVESDQVAPLNIYGHSKAAAERAVFERHPSALVVRSSAFFGPWDSHNFVSPALAATSRSRQAMSPTWSTPASIWPPTGKRRLAPEQWRSAQLGRSGRQGGRARPARTPAVAWRRVRPTARCTANAAC